MDGIETGIVNCTETDVQCTVHVVGGVQQGLHKVGPHPGGGRQTEIWLALYGRG